MKWHLLQSDATRLPFADGSVDLVFGSPPYMDARTYGIGAQRGCTDWVEWMLKVVAECVRVSKGLVLINCGGVTRDRCYWPGCEGLLYEWWKRGGQCWRPAYWHRVGIPGSGGKQWLRADIEYVLAFKRDDEWLEWADNTACGSTPKNHGGGGFSHRLSNGDRVSRPRPEWMNGGKLASMALAATAPKVRRAIAEMPAGAYLHSKPNKNGETVQVYIPPKHTNPGNVIKTTVGWGHMGHPLAHENDAPFPEKLAEFFIKSWAAPGGIVLDPFSGSGTTVSVARRLGRIGIGTDLRFNQCELGRRRVIESLSAKPVKRSKPQRERKEQGQLFAA